jgi:catechol 2,3-dioxygenase-like lactoylglutathione lyase family enzyme
MDDLLTRLLTDYERGMISRRKLLRTLGMTAVGAPLAAAFGTSAFGQGGCRDGYGQGRCPLTKEVATAPIKPIFASTGWKTVALENIVFDVLDYKKEAAFYIALMGWKLRNDDGKRAIMDMGEWGSCIFRQAPASAFAAPAQNAGARGGGGAAGGGGRGGRGGGNPVTATVKGFAFVIEPWNAKTVEAELKKRGMEPIADNDGKGFESFRVKDPDGWDLQICNGGGLAKARKTAPTAKLSQPLPFEATNWKTVWLDHLSFGVSNYKQSVSYYTNLLGWKESYDEGTQNELMIGDVGDAIVRGGNPNDPNFGRGGRGGGGEGEGGGRGARIDHISFGISPWDVDGVRADLEKRELQVSVDTSSAHLGPDGKMVSDDIHNAAFQSYHTRTPNGYNLQISWMTKDKRLALAMAVKPKTPSK